jgi:hypothetical protein
LAHRQLEQLVTGVVTREELQEIAKELLHRKPKPRTVALKERVAELLEEKSVG